MSSAYYLAPSFGSKTWFIPYAKQFLGDWTPSIICEAFAGSAVLGLDLLMNGYTEKLVLAEIDEGRRTFLSATFNDPDFSARVGAFTEELIDVPHEKVRDFVTDYLQRTEHKDPPLHYLISSRTTYNGCGGGRRSGREIKAHWPGHLAFSIWTLYSEAGNKVDIMSDAFAALEHANRDDGYAFIDPPYSLTPDSPGWYYPHGGVDHKRLRDLLVDWRGAFQLTYENTPEVLNMYSHFDCFDIPMRIGGQGRGSSRTRHELLIEKRTSPCGQ